MKVITVVIFSLQVIEIVGKLRVIPDERYENCDETPSEGFFRLTNITNMYFEFKLTDDYKVILNSNLTLLVPITLKKKLIIKISGKHWYLGKWQERFTSTMLDTCTDIFNPLGITYRYTKNLKRCPYVIGVRFKIYKE